MQVNKINLQNVQGIRPANFIKLYSNKEKQYKYMQDACYRMSSNIGVTTETLLNLTKDADAMQFKFLQTMANRFNHHNFVKNENDSQHILNIFSNVKKPTSMHINIVSKSNNSFENLEKIFSSATDDKSLEFVQDMQQEVLKEAKNPLKIISDLLTSKNRELFIKKPQNYESYLKLHVYDENLVKNLDELIESGKYSRFRFDAQLAINKLMRKKKINVAMAGKTDDLTKMYTKDRENFLTDLVNSFIPSSKAPKEETKAVVVNMYGSLNSQNSKLRTAIVNRFKNEPLKDKAAEIIEMQKLFNKIDNDADAKTFVQKAINKDLNISSIAELNEVLEIAPLKKANIFFNNAKRIIEKSTGEERKTALIVELENPFFESKTPKFGKARLVRMFSDRPEKENIFTRTYKIIENRINQYRYSRLSA